MKKYYLFLLIYTSEVFAGVDIGTSSGLFGKLVDLLQEFLDALQGPLAIGFIAVSLVLSLLAWTYAPKNGAGAWIVRGIIAMVVIFNLAVFINNLR